MSEQRWVISHLTKSEVQGKRVRFYLKFPNRIVEGTGIFRYIERPDGLKSIDIEVIIPEIDGLSFKQTIHYFPQSAVDCIKPSDFSDFDYTIDV